MMSASSSQAPFADIEFLDVKAVKRDLASGGFILSSGHELGSYPASMGEVLKRQARAIPERTLFAERGPDGSWKRLTFGEAGDFAHRIAAAYLKLGFGADRPVMILSGNSLDHAVLMLAGYLVGVPIAPVSVAYSLMSQDRAKLKHVFNLVKPGLIYAQDGKMFGPALAALDLKGVEVVVSSNPPDGIKARLLSELLATSPGAEVEAAFARVGPDTVAKYLFTSGSTGMPKGVINTHRMMAANQKMIEMIWPFVKTTPPVLLEWMPWNHTFGGNHDTGMVLSQGGTMYIDGGRPMPGMFEQTIRNLQDVSPTIMLNVPVAYNMLVPVLEKDPALAAKFFSKLQLIFYAGAALPQDLWTRLEALSVKTLGKRVVMVSSWGSTETAPMATAVHWPLDRAGVIGVPAPGVEIKMVPSGSKLEMRVRGPNVTPGYLGRPDLTADAFDEDGFYRIGDAGKLLDADNPAKGIVFDGRVAEDFKLTTGTWVHVGGLRIAALAACTPALQDAVVAGHDRAYVSLLAWPNLNALKEICTDPAAHADTPKLLAAPEVVAHIRKGLQAHNAGQQGSSMQIKRVMLMAEPPSIDANEITDKGYINQRAALERRDAQVKALYADPPGPGVIVID